MGRILKGILAFLIFVVVAAALTLKRGDIRYEALEQRYSMAASKFIDLETDLKVHYVDIGPRDSQNTILLVHGFAASVHIWTDWLRGLQSGYRVIAVDLPLHGLTRTPDGWHSDVKSDADFMNTFIDTMKLKDIILVGAGTSGDSAWRYADSHRDNVIGLVLVGSTGWEQVETDIGSDPLRDDLMAQPWLKMLFQHMDMKPQIENWLTASFISVDFPSDAMVQRYSDLSRAPGRRRGLLDRLSQPLSPLDAEELADFTIPTLILHGEKDAVTPPRFASKFRDTIPNSELIIYEGVGHMPYLEIPRRSIEDLRAFLNRVMLPAPDSNNQALESVPTIAPKIESDTL